METIGNLIETYENNNVTQIMSSPTETLSSLMSEHNLKQSDLPEIGSQGVSVRDNKGKKESKYTSSQRVKYKIWSISTGLYSK